MSRRLRCCGNDGEMRGNMTRCRLVVVCHRPRKKEDDNEGRMMAQQEAGDGEGGDLVAGTPGTFVIHLFDRDGNERGNKARQAVTKERRWQNKTTTGRG